MDPDRAWLQLARAVEEGDRDEALELAEGLAAWLRNEGFPPHITGWPRFDQMVAFRVCESVLTSERG